MISLTIELDRSLGRLTSGELDELLSLTLSLASATLRWLSLSAANQSRVNQNGAQLKISLNDCFVSFATDVDVTSSFSHIRNVRWTKLWAGSSSPFRPSDGRWHPRFLLCSLTLL